MSQAPVLPISLLLCGSHTHCDLLRETFMNRSHHHYSRHTGASQTQEQYLNPSPAVGRLPSLSELHFPPLCSWVARVILRIQFHPSPSLRWIFLLLKFQLKSTPPSLGSFLTTQWFSVTLLCFNSLHSTDSVVCVCVFVYELVGCLLLLE